MTTAQIVTRNEDITLIKNQFDEDGIVGPYTLYDKSHTNDLLKVVRKKMIDKTNAIYPNATMNYDRHIDIQELKQLVHEPAIVDRVSAILGQDILCWRTEWFPKYPGDSGTMWHQAQNFRTFGGKPKLIPTKERSGPFEVTVWFAFTDAKQETGCLKVVPGTHRQMHFNEDVDLDFSKENKAGFYGYDFNETKFDKDWAPDESKKRLLEMDAGEFTIFTSRCIHGSEPNVSKNQTRMGLAIRYVPTDVDIYRDMDSFTQFGEKFDVKNHRSFLVCGKNTYTHNVVAE